MSRKKGEKRKIKKIRERSENIRGKIIREKIRRD
jgi:hypothetical protein